MNKTKYILQRYDETKHQWKTMVSFPNESDALFMLMEHFPRARLVYKGKPIKKNYTKFGQDYYKTFQPINW